MSDVTRLLDAAAAGDRRAAADLLPLVYEELRRLATARLADEPAGHTLQPTALVHEAYLRLVGPTDPARWTTRTHFVTAAAEAMRRILVDHARRRRAAKRGGGRGRVALPDVPQPDADEPVGWVEIDDALARLATEDAQAAEIVRLKVFAGLSVDEAADLLGISRATAYRDWAYARAWLREAVGVGQNESANP